MVAGSHDSDFGSILELHRIAGAGNGLVLKLDSDKLLGDSPGFLGNNGIFTDKLILIQFAEHAETCHDRGYLRSQLIPIKRKTGLETKGVTATESARSHTCLEESFPILDYHPRSRINLKTILSGVAGTTHYDSHAGILEILECIEG